MSADDVETFEEFFVRAEPRLRRALTGRRPPDQVADAVAAALTYAFQEWQRVRRMDHPIAYLYRVGLSKTRRRRQGYPLVAPSDPTMDVEPRLIEAMRGLPTRQREVVWLVDGCGWRVTEAAAALDISLSATRTHRERALQSLRERLGVEMHG